MLVTSTLIATSKLLLLLSKPLVRSLLPLVLAVLLNDVLLQYYHLAANTAAAAAATPANADAFTSNSEDVDVRRFGCGIIAAMSS